LAVSPDLVARLCLSEAALERAQSASSEAVEEKFNNIAEKRVSLESGEDMLKSVRIAAVSC